MRSTDIGNAMIEPSAIIGYKFRERMVILL